MSAKIKIATLSVFGILALFAGNAQQVFYAQSVQQLYMSLPETCAVAGSATIDTVVLCRNMVQGDIVPIVYSWDENRVLEHVGYRFLSDSATVKDVIVRFLERELLSALLSDDVNQTLVTYRENGLSVKLDNEPVKPSLLKNRRQLSNLLKSSQGITINYDGKNYDITLLCGDSQELSFQFRADSELITGMDKREREIRLAFQLKNHKAAGSVSNSSLTSTDYSYLKLMRDTIYADRGSSYLIPQVNNDLFYVKADSAYSLAFDKSLIAESFSNALLVPAGNRCKIKVTHRMYGKTVEKYTVESRDFDDYFSHGYDRYFGIESLKKEKLTGTLILSDRNAWSIHMAYVSVSLDDLLNGGTMEMQLYSNIPQQNIKSLFGKYHGKKDK
ncbi:MAG: hypothetical protein LBK97_03225 [Prevotellaceae bacterium]|jgi:hypothetical protein|nr:hypothetical protein [Prevotellaceae bacterium]